jgi:predicted AAA+ superfamily ATPase
MPPLLDLLTTLNPWWTGRDYDTGKLRPAYISRIMRYTRTGEVVVLSGVRRSGKTTLLLQTVRSLIEDHHVPSRNIMFVNCDEPEISGLESPFLTIVDAYRKEVPATGTLYLIFDEIQGVPGWEQSIKSLYDRKEYRILISGSSSYLLDSEISTRLSGRYFTVPVYPLDFSEYLSFQGIEVPGDPVGLASGKYELLHNLKRYLREGGFPVVVLQGDERTKRDYLKAYYDSIVYRDIVRVNEVRNQKALAGLLHYLFTHFTAPYSYRRLGALLGIDLSSVRDYVHFAEMAKVLVEVHHFAYSLQVQKRSNRKPYCIDNGLRNAVAFRFSEDEGKLAENLVCVELLRSGADLYYWKKVKEVDFVVKHPDNLLTAINVTYTDTVPYREVEGLTEFAEEFGDRVTELLLLTRDREEVRGAIRVVPLWKWLLREK